MPRFTSLRQTVTGRRDLSGISSTPRQHNSAAATSADNNNAKKQKKSPPPPPNSNTTPGTGSRPLPDSGGDSVGTGGAKQRARSKSVPDCSALSGVGGVGCNDRCGGSGNGSLHNDTQNQSPSSFYALSTPWSTSDNTNNNTNRGRRQRSATMPIDCTEGADSRIHGRDEERGDGGFHRNENNLFAATIHRGRVEPLLSMESEPVPIPTPQETGRTYVEEVGWGTLLKCAHLYPEDGGYSPSPDKIITASTIAGRATSQRADDKPSSPMLTPKTKVPTPMQLPGPSPGYNSSVFRYPLPQSPPTDGGTPRWVTSRPGLASGRGTTSVVRIGRSFRGGMTCCSPDRETVCEQQRTGPAYSGAGEGTASQEAEGGGDPVPALDYDEYIDDELFLDDDGTTQFDSDGTIQFNSDGSTADDMESSLIFELEM